MYKYVTLKKYVEKSNSTIINVYIYIYIKYRVKIKEIHDQRYVQSPVDRSKREEHRHGGVRMFSRGIRADAGARVRARKNTAKYAAELRLYTRTRMFESGATSAFRVCVGARCSRARAAVCW